MVTRSFYTRRWMQRMKIDQNNGIGLKWMKVDGYEYRQMKWIMLDEMDKNGCP